MKLPKRALCHYELFDYHLEITHFRGVYTSPPTPHYNKSTIVNLASQKTNDTHWVAYNKHGTTVEYIDSFGDLKPQYELAAYFGETADILYNTDFH